MFSTTLFLLAVVAYASLAFGYRPYLDGRIRELRREVDAQSQQISSGDQTKLLGFYSQIANLNTLLGKHASALPLFEFLEKNTHPNIYFTSMNLIAASKRVVLGGMARSVSDISEQLARIQSQPEVKQVILGSSSATLDGWRFDLTLDLTPDFLTWSLVPEAADTGTLTPATTTTSTSTPTSSVR